MDKYAFTKETNRGRRRGLPGGEPLKTVQELAEEFGTTPHSLASLLGHSDERKPKPAMQFNSRLIGHKTYYRPSEVRLWWKTVMEKKNGPQ
jgi:hypothetical protein